MSLEIFFRSRVTYFFLAVATVFVAAFFILQKIEDLELMASPVSEDQIKVERKLKVLFVGDTMLDRVVRTIAEKEGYDYPFSAIRDFASRHDLAVLNLEGIFTDNESVSQKNMEILRFTFDPKGASAIKEAGFSAVSQANNHTNDFGREGLVASKQYLRQADVTPFGDFFNEGEPMYMQSKGQKIALIGFNEFSYTNSQRIASQITEAKSAGYFTVVLPHWGVEYERFPSESQARTAREWIDLGADAVIGSHPHVVQIIEEYKGKIIFYSLGNFIFDQNFSKTTQEGLALSLSLDSTTAAFKISGVRIERARPELMTGEERDLLLADLAKDSDINDDWKESLRISRELKVKR